MNIPHRRLVPRSPYPDAFIIDFNDSWLEIMRDNQLPFEEPHLDCFLTDKVKLFCDGLEQDDHVFVTAVEILDKYVAVNNRNKTRIKDPFVIVLSACYLAGKLTGDLADMKTVSIMGLYEKLMKKPINNTELKRVEIHILTMLDYKLPLTTQIDDLTMLVHLFIDPLNLNIYFHGIAMNVLLFYLTNRMSLFKQLCHFYAEGEDLSKKFKPLYVSRFYVPFGVIICVLNLLSLPFSAVNVDSLSVKFSEVCHISSEHLCFLAHLIYELWRYKKMQI